MRPPTPRRIVAMHRLARRMRWPGFVTAAVAQSSFLVAPPSSPPSVPMCSPHPYYGDDIVARYAVEFVHGFLVYLSYTLIA
jgi:hypothetical protein